MDEEEMMLFGMSRTYSNLLLDYVVLIKRI